MYIMPNKKKPVKKQFRKRVSKSDKKVHKSNKSKHHNQKQIVKVNVVGGGGGGGSGSGGSSMPSAVPFMSNYPHPPITINVPRFPDASTDSPIRIRTPSPPPSPFGGGIRIIEPITPHPYRESARIVSGRAAEKRATEMRGTERPTPRPSSGLFADDTSSVNSEKSIPLRAMTGEEIRHPMKSFTPKKEFLIPRTGGGMEGGSDFDEEESGFSFSDASPVRTTAVRTPLRRITRATLLRPGYVMNAAGTRQIQIGGAAYHRDYDENGFLRKK